MSYRNLLRAVAVAVTAAVAVEVAVSSAEAPVGGVTDASDGPQATRIAAIIALKRRREGTTA